MTACYIYRAPCFFLDFAKIDPGSGKSMYVTSLRAQFTLPLSHNSEKCIFSSIVNKSVDVTMKENTESPLDVRLRAIKVSTPQINSL